MIERIKQLRKILKLSQKDFASKIGFTASALCDIEHKRSPITNRLIYSICYIFSVNENWLRYNKGEIFIKNNNFFNIYNSKKY